MKTIAFDIDGTWALNPVFWRETWDSVVGIGWRPIIVTGSHQPREKLDRLLVPHDAVIIVSSRATLKEEAARKAGYNVDVWIDDMPGMIQECKILGGSLDEPEVTPALPTPFALAAKLADEYPAGSTVYHRSSGRRGVVAGHVVFADASVRILVDYQEMAAYDYAMPVSLSASPPPNDDGDKWKSGQVEP